MKLAISKERLNELPAVRYHGNITVVETPEMEEAALKDLSNYHEVGFDTETKPSFKKGKLNNVSLIQVSTGERCYLFRLNKLGFTPGIRHFMEDEGIVKIGLSLKDDFSVLHRNCEFAPKGFVDLQSYVKEYSISDMSLSKIYGILFGERISKNQRLSNWEAPVLTEGQQVYASIDAWACLRIYRYLQSGGFEPENSPYIVNEDEQQTND